MKTQVLLMINWVIGRHKCLFMCLCQLLEVHFVLPSIKSEKGHPYLWKRKIYPSIISDRTLIKSNPAQSNGGILCPRPSLSSTSLSLWQPPPPHPPVFLPPCTHLIPIFLTTCHEMTIRFGSEVNQQNVRSSICTVAGGELLERGSSDGGRKLSQGQL